MREISHKVTVVETYDERILEASEVSVEIRHRAGQMIRNCFVGGPKKMQRTMSGLKKKAQDLIVRNSM